MKYRSLGQTGVQVSEIGFGCGDNASLIVNGTAAERREVVEKALAAGINYFDTADHYGEGKSETNLGVTLRELGADPFVASKVRLSAADLEDLSTGVRGACEGSLQRLGMDQVGLYYLHSRVAPERRFGPRGPTHISVDDVLGPVWETLLKLQEEGRMRFLGICTSGSDAASIRTVLDKLPFDVVQGEYSMLNPTEGRPPSPGFEGRNHGQTFEYAGGKGMGIVVYRALAAGALTQSAGSAVRPSPSRNSEAWIADMERARALETLKGESEEKLAGTAVRFALANPNVSSVLLGFSKKAYIDEANGYSDAGPLPAETLRRFDDLYANDFGRVS